MKRWICLLLAAMLFIPALAEGFEGYENSEVEGQEFADIGNARQLEFGTVYSLDLDGDGTEESIRASVQEGEDMWGLRVSVEGNNASSDFDCGVIYSEAAYVVDLDGDGKAEILLTGDEASEDYFTWCLKFNGEEGLQPIEFADANRGENTGDYFECGYGRIRIINGSELTLVGSQDALGTWMCSRKFALRGGRFELDDGGVWYVAEDLSNPDIWEHRALVVTSPVPVTLEDGNPSTLPEGTSLLITATDKVSFVEYRTKKGDTGRISISPNVDGWGSLIDGKPETDYFEYIPYAD